MDTSWRDGTTRITDRSKREREREVRLGWGPMAPGRRPRVGVCVLGFSCDQIRGFPAELMRCRASAKSESDCVPVRCAVWIICASLKLLPLL